MSIGFLGDEWDCLFFGCDPVSHGCVGRLMNIWCGVDERLWAVKYRWDCNDANE